MVQRNMEAKKFYRYERDRTSSFEKLDLIKFSLIKETPKGNWIRLDNSWGWKFRERWVSNTSRKRYAHPTKKEALISYIYRTERRIKYLESDLSITNELLRQAKKLLEETIVIQ